MTEKEIETRTHETFERVCARLAFWFEHGLSLDEYIDTVDTVDEDIIEGYKAQGDFFEYGLSLEFKPADGNTDGHYVYLIAWGGPQYKNGRKRLISKTKLNAMTTPGMAYPT